MWLHFLLLPLPLCYIHPASHWSLGSCSVAMVFDKIGIMVSGKLAKIVRIFVDIGHIKNQGVIYWPERIGLVIPTLWSGHNFGQNLWPKLWPLHSVGNTGLILSGQYMTLRFLMCPMSTNILTILSNFPDTIIPILSKTSVMTVATLGSCVLTCTCLSSVCDTLSVKSIISIITMIWAYLCIWGGLGSIGTWLMLGANRFADKAASLPTRLDFSPNSQIQHSKS